MLKSLAGRTGKSVAVIAGAVLLAAGSALAVGHVGDMAAEWSGLKDLNGKTHALKDYQGKVVLLMTVQHNCGGCRANAPRIGQIAKGFQGAKFQAVGPDINYANATDLGSFGKLLKGTDTSLNFPLLSGLKAPEIKDSIKGGANFGTMWVPYDALRDVFFVIDHTGKIVHRLDGNRGSAVDAGKYTALTAAITAAIAAVPTVSISSPGQGGGMCLQACKRNGAFSFDLSTGRANLAGNASMKIMDTQGRLIRSLALNATGAEARAMWDGKDSQGKTAAWGSYFVNASAPGQSTTLLLTWLP
jgi:peroxiredoxin